MSKDIFISHAVKDKILADELVDLLQLGLNLNTDRIFCSSLEGLGIPPGDNFIDHIKDQLQSPKAVIALITPNYYASQFCLCELGATWSMSLKFFPLLVPPLNHSDVKGVLTGTQLTTLSNAESLSELKDHLLKALESTGVASARWEVKRDTFLKKFPKILKRLPKPETVAITEYKKTTADLKSAKVAIFELESELERLQSLVTGLTHAKDKAEVVAIKAAHQPAEVALEELEGRLEEKLRRLPKCVSFVIFKELGVGQRVKLDGYNNRIFAQQISDAQNEQLVEIDDNGYCSLNLTHPKIKTIITQLKELKRFIANAPAELFDAFELHHETPLSIENRKYWEWALDERISSIDG